VDGRITVDLFQDSIERFVQSEEMDEKGLIDPLVEEVVPFLPEGEDPARGLNDVGSRHLGEPEKLSAFQ
jgi:hypothetical protein